MIGLVFVRGYPHNVLPAEAKLCPRGLFQANEIERWTHETGKTIQKWVAIGGGQKSTGRPANPGFKVALEITDNSQCPIVMDNIYRLLSGVQFTSPRWALAKTMTYTF